MRGEGKGEWRKEVNARSSIGERDKGGERECESIGR